MHARLSWLAWFVLLSQAGQLAAQDINDINRRFSQAHDAGRYLEAEKLSQQLVSVAERLHANDPSVLAAAYNNRGLILSDLGKQAESKTEYLRALKILEKAFAKTDARVLDCVNNLGALYEEMGQYDEAEKYHRRALEGREQTMGRDSLAASESLNNLGMVYLKKGQFAAAEEAYARSLKIKRAKLGEIHADTARTLNNSGTVKYTQGKWSEAEAIFRAALKILERLSPDHPRATQAMNNLASALLEQKRYQEAEPLYDRVLKIRRKHYGERHPEVALSLNNLALLYQHQNRMAEAEPLFKQALLMRQEFLGTDHAEILATMTTLADFYLKTGRLSEAEPLLKRILRTQQASPEVHGLALLTTLNRYGDLKKLQNLPDEAAGFYRRALDAQIVGDSHRETVYALTALSTIYRQQEKYAEAEPLVSRVIAAQQPGASSYHEAFEALELRSRIRKALGKTMEALADAQLALQFAEQQQALPTLPSGDQKPSFAPYADAFSRVAQWQAAAGDTEGAIATAERYRGRALLEQLRAAKIDPLGNANSPEATALRSAYADAQIRVRTLTSEYAELQNRRGLTDTVRSQETTRLAGELTEARQAAVSAYRAINQASRQRTFVPGDENRFRSATWQAWSRGRSETILYYLIGAEASYVVRLSPGEPPQATPLVVDKTLGERLKIEPGPLREEPLNTLLRGGPTSVLRCLSTGVDTAAARSQLHDLMQLLLPEAERQQLIQGQIPKLVIIPDGPLMSLPFEALIVQNRATPQYLLDVETTLTYAPSLAIFQYLADQQTLQTKKAPVSVLTLGDPNYGRAANSTDARSRAWVAAERLPALPHTGLETDLVKKAFADRSFSVTQLRDEQATESSIRAALTDRTVLHFACHGLVDQDFENLFGALAITPGAANAEPHADGLLTLAELNELNLQSVDLAILSACQTNYGPQQKGEGVWALSRGFLVGGSRRVVASNWLVDDESAANLISLYCSGVSEDLNNGTLQSATRLRQAKRLIRQDEKWSAPYYWAPFVQLGPN